MASFAEAVTARAEAGLFPYLIDNTIDTNYELGLAVTVPCPAGYDVLCKMKREQLARRLAKESGVSTARAADQLDRIISEILTRVRKGQSAALPGFGTFRPGRGPRVQFDLGLPQDSGGLTRPGPGKDSR